MFLSLCSWGLIKLNGTLDPTESNQHHPVQCVAAYIPLFNAHSSLGSWFAPKLLSSKTRATPWGQQPQPHKRRGCYSHAFALLCLILCSQSFLCLFRSLCSVFSKKKNQELLWEQVNPKNKEHPDHVRHSRCISTSIRHWPEAWGIGSTATSGGLGGVAWACPSVIRVLPCFGCMPRVIHLYHS